MSDPVKNVETFENSVHEGVVVDTNNEPENDKNEVDEVVKSEVLKEKEEEKVSSNSLNLDDKDHIIDMAEHEDLEGDLKEIYGLVYKKVALIVSTGKFTAEHLRPLILNIIEIVQEYTDNKYHHIDGAQKKAMALNILRQVVVDLHNKGQINQENYELILLSLEFFGGALIDLGKAAWTALVNAIDDVTENGCAGCFGRNCRRKRK